MRTNSTPARDGRGLGSSRQALGEAINTVRSNSRGRYSTPLKRLKTRRRSERARRLAIVESLGALSGNLKARVRADLIRLYGPLRISFVEMAELAGGMRITVGHDLYYGSVRGTLAALEEELQH